MQVDPQVVVEAEHQPAPSAAIIAVTSEVSRPEHSSSSTTPLGSVADKRASGAARGDGRCDSRCSDGCGDGSADSAGVDTGDSSIKTTGTKADGACAIASRETPVTSRRSCSCTHLRNWFALTPAFSARPANDAPGWRQASINLRLPSGSYRCLPSAHVRVTRRGRKSKSVSVIICVRNSSLRTQSWIDSAAPAMCGEFRAYHLPAKTSSFYARMHRARRAARCGPRRD
ncbi:hypothetical protein A33K_18486 [Burkholderia humptydooensis MSMB43]|uniref:Uncharacterized protein n=1 Tax=Burkholderia humptydooensis MSMB43 TaxID=441157 RepID=A0ABN0FY51_9BURK|nr:hypothetical protein A33K_18486 [Burkholderia humptydooensis MSMB43]